MSFFYVVIARDKEVILVDYEDARTDYTNKIFEVIKRS